MDLVKNPNKRKLYNEILQTEEKSDDLQILNQNQVEEL